VRAECRQSAGDARLDEIEPWGDDQRGDHGDDACAQDALLEVGALDEGEAKQRGEQSVVLAAPREAADQSGGEYAREGSFKDRAARKGDRCKEEEGEGRVRESRLGEDPDEGIEVHEQGGDRRGGGAEPLPGEPGCERHSTNVKENGDGGAGAVGRNQARVLNESDQERIERRAEERLFGNERIAPRRDLGERVLALVKMGKAEELQAGKRKESRACQDGDREQKGITAIAVRSHCGGS
jgi:hypothetical protein